MITQKLNTLKKITNGQIFNNKNDIEISNISTDSRQKKGGLFLALKGNRFDGHNFIEQAISNGVQAICSHQPIKCNIPNLLVKDTLEAYQNIATHQLKIQNCFTIGITGSSGKTSIRAIIEHYLTSMKSSEQVLGTLGNTNNHIGVPANILRLTPRHKFAVLEIGTNHYGEIANLCNIASLDIAIIANIGLSHIGNFTDYNQLIDEKLSLFSGLKNNGLAILPYDLFVKHQNSPHLQNKKIITFGTEPEANIIYSYDKSTLEKSYGIINNINIESSLLGEHQLSNLAIAYCAIINTLEITSRQFADIAQNLSLPKMRMEIIKSDNHTWINDSYNANPESMLAVIKWFSEIVNKKMDYFLILGDMLELGSQSQKYHQQIINYLKQSNLLQHTILIGQEMMQTSHQGVYQKFITSGEAQYFCQNNLPKNSLILLKASRGIQLEKIC